MTNTFRKEVCDGLKSTPKTLPSKYFYDAVGDELFVQIMHMPEYYLTRAEHEIFKTKSDDIIAALKLQPDTYFELIELGAGDGKKTKELLRRLHSRNFNFNYFPIDISEHALDQLECALNMEMPELKVQKQQGDYFGILESLKASSHPKVVLFLGSNIGNMQDEKAATFIYQLGANLKKGDKLFLGVDLIKPAEIVMPAYNDAAGITRAFNMNLLQRINRELEGNFDLSAFEHQPEYTEQDGIARSFLRSKVKQEVKVGDETFYFDEGELIHTEISRKYNDEILQQIINGTDFKVEGKLTDSKQYFADYILIRN